MIEYKNEKMYKRCEFLQDLGFDIINEDSTVRMEDLTFDFSATSMDVKSVIKMAIHQAYRLGEQDGTKNIQDEIKGILAIE